MYQLVLVVCILRTNPHNYAPIKLRTYFTTDLSNYGPTELQTNAKGASGGLGEDVLMKEERGKWEKGEKKRGEEGEERRRGERRGGWEEGGEE